MGKVIKQTSLIHAVRHLNVLSGVIAEIGHKGDLFHFDNVFFYFFHRFIWLMKMYQEIY